MTEPLTYERLTAPVRKAASWISEGLGTFPQKHLTEREIEKLAEESICHDIVDQAVAMFRARQALHTAERKDG